MPQRNKAHFDPYQSCYWPAGAKRLLTKEKRGGIILRGHKKY